MGVGAGDGVGEGDGVGDSVGDRLGVGVGVVTATVDVTAGVVSVVGNRQPARSKQQAAIIKAVMVININRCRIMDDPLCLPPRIFVGGESLNNIP